MTSGPFSFSGLNARVRRCTATRGRCHRRVVAQSLKSYLESFPDLQVVGTAPNGETLLAAIRTVAGGATYLDPSVSRAVLAAANPADALTDRELDVLRQLVLGRSNKEVAQALALGEETVKTHVGSLLSKLQVENRSQAVVHALKRGLVTLDD